MSRPNIVLLALCIVMGALLIYGYNMHKSECDLVLNKANQVQQSYQMEQEVSTDAQNY